jgi:glycosyltransferase involved in cell wall biosynthesis
MKIALVVPGFSAHEKDWCIPALLNYVRALALQAEVHVFTLRWPERSGTYSVFGAKVHVLDGRKRLGVKVFSLWARALRLIAVEHRRAPFDVLHAFWADEPGWVAAWAGNRLNVPVIISLAGGELVGLRDIGYGLQLLPGRRFLVQWGLAHASRVTAGSNYLLGLARQSLPQSHWAKLVRAPFGVDTDRFSPSRLTPHASRLTSHASRLTAINVGSLIPVKNQALLLCALARVPLLSLRVVGVGALRNELQALASELKIAERVEFLGEVNHDDLPALYQTGDVFIQTSRHEAQGMAALEAAACGLPVVGTPVGVLPEIGMIARDEAELAQHLIELIADPPRWKTLGEAARAKVEADFSLGVAMKRFIDVYRSVAMRSAPGPAPQSQS